MPITSGYSLNDLVKMGPSEIERQMALAAALRQQAGGDGRVDDPLEGVAMMANALFAGLGQRKAEKASLAGKEGASRRMADLAAALGGGGQFPKAPGAQTAGAPTHRPVDPNVGSTIDFARAGTPQPQQRTAFNGDLRSGILATAEGLGIDPVDLATVMSYETAGTFNPTQKGPRTQWGQHRGLIQFGEPQAKKFGVDWENPLASQLGPDGAVAQYLRDAGVKPGMGILDVYSAINAGGVGRYGASDANNGGAPGTVRDKVEQQMGGHRQKALQLLGDMGQPPAAQAINAMAAPPPPDMEGGVPAGAGVPPQAQMAQALMGGQRDTGMPGMAGNAGPIDTVNGPSIQQLFEAGGNEFMNPGQRGLIEALLGQKLKQSDPAYQMEQETNRLKLDALRNPQMSPYEAEQIRLKSADAATSAAKDAFDQSDTTADNERDAARLKIEQEKAGAAAPEVVEAYDANGQAVKMQWNSATKRYEILGGSKAADTGKVFDDVSGLRKEIQSLPSYKNLSQAAPIYRAMSETAGRDSRASDLNMVYGLGKIMDPGSVVREGEMFMVQGVNTLPDKVIEGINSLLTGASSLSPETRKAIMQEAYGRVKGYEQQFGQDAAQYKGIVERNRFNPDDVLPNLGTFEEWAGPPAAAPGEGTPPPVDNDPPPVTLPPEIQELWKFMPPEDRALWR